MPAPAILADVSATAWLAARCGPEHDQSNGVAALV
jgi:hypothetical protein